MTSIRTRKSRIALVLCLLVTFSWLGCGPAADPTAPPPIQAEDKEKLAAALPPGVTLESSIEPNVMLGANSKTVGEALASLHAYVKDNKIYDGGMSKVILFKTGKDDSKSKPAKSSKTKEESTTIVVTGG
ncbi:MAG: hypothetical protein P4L85_19370 [Paludisphaera borealis]|uniref:hypothetical protein n=1 Tax=Paludisphaera borealis TaxID=1387353 RepID=UPI00283E4411|nr:hypothetical protein [Paludisphaera borealis]MDR3621520.1 hypothetical protein [Paludisphaera borealis]